MSPEDCMRAGLAALTLVLVVYIVIVREGRLADDTQFWAVVISLMVCVLLAADECRTASPLWRTLMALEAFDQQFASLQALPWTAYNTIAPSLERLTGMIRGDPSGSETVTAVLKEKDYGGSLDPDLNGSDGKLDANKFAAMKLQYKRIASLLCRMKNMAPETHDSLVTAIAAC